MCLLHEVSKHRIYIKTEKSMEKSTKSMDLIKTSIFWKLLYKKVCICITFYFNVFSSHIIVSDTSLLLSLSWMATGVSTAFVQARCCHACFTLTGIKSSNTMYVDIVSMSVVLLGQNRPKFWKWPAPVALKFVGQHLVQCPKEWKALLVIIVGNFRTYILFSENISIRPTPTTFLTAPYWDHPHCVSVCIMPQRILVATTTKISNS